MVLSLIKIIYVDFHNMKKLLNKIINVFNTTLNPTIHNLPLSHLVGNPYRKWLNGSLLKILDAINTIVIK